MSRIPEERIVQDAERLLECGAPLGAYDVLAEGLADFPGHIRMRQLQALALSRSGASRLANPILQQLVREGHRDEETAGMLARTHKDLWAAATDPDERRVHLGLAFRQYADALGATLGYWTGINAATMALLLGNGAEAKTLARAVREQCLALHKKDASADAYWIAATLGEAALLLESWNEAEDWYARRPRSAGASSATSSRRGATRGSSSRISTSIPRASTPASRSLPSSYLPGI